MPAKMGNGARMPSTLVTRIVAPWELTQAQKDAVDAEVPSAAAEEYKIPILPLSAVAQEVIAGRIPATNMLAWITAAEKADADDLITKINAGDFTLDEIERILLLGERAVYTVAQIEAILWPST